MTEFTSLIYKTEGRVAHLILNRPHRLNAIDSAMPRDIEAAVQKANDDDGVHAIVLSGAGKGFCGGYDLVEFAEKEDEPHTQEMPWDPMIDYKFMKANTDAFSSLWRSYKPTIAKIHGPAFGGAVGLISCCDIAIAIPSSTFCFSEVKIGLIPATIAPYIIQTIGVSHAQCYFLSAETIDAQQALNLGLLHKVVDREELDLAIEKTIQNLLANSPKAMGAIKALIKEIQYQPINEDVQHATCKRLAEIRMSDQGQEGLSAFLEKRHPSWQSN